MTAAPNSSATLDRDEVARFAKLADAWWDEKGPVRPLHQITTTRLT
jgi:2-polyprenyl-6-hydroxyphenyl methylase/3-demethylubiquinone-9 3-methyltransferase